MKGPVELEDLFAAGRDEAVPDAAFLARIEAAALAHQPQRDPTPARAGGFAAILRAIGGWRAAGGLATAAVVGLWIGVNDPGGLLGNADTDVLFDGLAGGSNPFAADGEEG